MDRAVTGRLRPMEALAILLPIALIVLISAQTAGLLIQASRLLGDAPGPAAPDLQWHVLVLVPPSASSPETGLVEAALLDLRESAAEAGIALQFSQAPAGSNASIHLQRQARTAVLTGLDAVIALQPTPTDAAMLSRELDESGIPLILTGTPGPSDFVGSAIASVDTGQGERIGRFAAGLGVTAPDGLPARVALLCQSCAEWPDPQNTPMVSGFRASLEQTGLRWAGLQVVDGSIAEATRAAREIGSRADDVDLVYADSLQGTLGMTQAVLDLNLVGRMAILGTGTNDRIQDLLEDRVIAATVIRDPAEIAESVLLATLWRLNPEQAAPPDADLRIIAAPAADMEAQR